MPTYQIDRFLAPDECCHVARTRIGSSRHELHDHDYYELFWIETGDCRHLINGQDLPLIAGNLVLVRPTDCHSFEAAGAVACSLLNIAFPTTVALPLFERVLAVPGAAWGGTAVVPTVYRLGQETMRRLEDDAAELARQRTSRLLLERFILNLLYALQSPGAGAASAAGTGAAPRHGALPDWLSRACDGVREPTVFREGVAGFVRLAGRSPEHVAREARRCLGKTPSQLVNDARLDFAAAELGMSDAPIGEIALAAGYENLGYFYARFSAAYGTTPRKYRNRQRELV